MPVDVQAFGNLSKLESWCKGLQEYYLSYRDVRRIREALADRNYYVTPYTRNGYTVRIWVKWI